MKILGLDVSRRQKNKDPLKVTAKQPDTLIMAISEHLANHAHWNVKLFHRLGAKYSPVGELLVRDFAVVCGELEAYIREEYGAGDFRACIYNPSGNEVAAYEVPVGGPKAYKSSAGTIGTGTGDNKAGRSPKLSEFAEMVGVMKEMSGDSKVMDILMKQMELNALPAAPDPFKDQLLTTLYNNQITDKENSFQTAASIIELANQLKPSLPPEDATASLIQAIAPVLGAMFAGRGGAPVMGNGGLDVKSLQDAARSIPPDMIATLPPEQQAALSDFTGGAPAPSVLPRPGASPVPQVASGGADPGASPTPQPGSPPPSSGPNIRHQMIDLMVEEMRADLREGKSDVEIAGKFLGLMGFARSCPQDDPHPMMVGLLKATAETQNTEFMRFCAGIPELGRDHDRIEAIGIELLNLIVDSANSTLDQVESVMEQEEGDPAAERPIPFTYETEEQARIAQEEQGKYEPDEARPAGVPEPAEEEAPGTVESGGAGESPGPSREQEEPEAQAV